MVRFLLINLTNFRIRVIKGCISPTRLMMKVVYLVHVVLVSLHYLMGRAPCSWKNLVLFLIKVGFEPSSNAYQFRVCLQTANVTKSERR